MQVREIMSKDIEVVDRNDNLRTVEERMATKQLRHLPVLEQGEIVGIVTQRDLFKAAMSSAMGYGEKAQQAYLQSVRVKEIMTYPVVTVSPDTSVAAAAEMIINKGIGCLPVVDDHSSSASSPRPISYAASEPWMRREHDDFTHGMAHRAFSRRKGLCRSKTLCASKSRPSPLTHWSAPPTS